MATRLYIGKEVDPGSGALGERVDLDASDLLTHALIVGMTGSGKTGLAIALIEETLRSGVPVLAVDPKGDLGNLLLLFDRLSPEEFAPWIDAAEARREGKDVKTAAAETAEAWRKGLAEWGLSADDVAALRRGHDAVVYTPGSSAGVPLNLLQSLDAPAVPFESAEEDLREEIAAFATGVLGLLGIEADPLSSREHVFLTTLIEQRWRAGRGITLEELVGLVAEPPFQKMGALPLESVYPRKDRQALMMALNTLLASPRFEAWREGEPLDIERLLRAADGRPRLSVIYTAHLPDEERLFVTALLLEKVKTWMRRQGGTSELRALVYMDEIYGYFPPHPANPPPKRPLLTLLKQARAQGVSVVLATQNPVDLDYKGLANMGVWMVGKLQTRQDRDRLRGGLLGAGMAEAQVDALLDATRKRVFLLHDVHRPRPLLLHSRFVLSYLRGPMTREEIERLMEGRRPSAAVRVAQARGAAQQAADASSGPPPLPAPWRHSYLARHRGELAAPHLLVKYSARYGKGAEEVVRLRAWPLEAGTAAEALDADAIEVDEEAVTAEPPAGLRYSELPGFMGAPTAARAVEKALRERLSDKLEVTVWFDPLTERHAEPGEEAEAFAARLLSAGPGPDEAKLRERLERKKRELAAAELELSGRKRSKWVSVGTAILDGILGGGRGLSRTRRGLSKVGTVLNQDRMEGAAESRAEQLRAEVAELDSQVTGLMAVDSTRFEKKTVTPARKDVDLLRYDLLWVY